MYVEATGTFARPSQSYYQNRSCVNSTAHNTVAGTYIQFHDHARAEARVCLAEHVLF